MTAKATIISEINSKTFHDPTIYRIGITEDPTGRKEEWSATETTKYWKQWEADSSTDAKDIENYFINEKKMKGGTGGNISAKTTWVYVF